MDAWYAEFDPAPDLDWYLDHVLVYADPTAPVPRGPAGHWYDWWRRAALDLRGGPGELAARQGFVLTPAQAAAAGLPRHRLRTLVRRGEWTRPAYGVVSPIGTPGASRQRAIRRGHVLAASAAALLRPTHVVTGRSAAITYGLPTLSVPERPELTQRPAATLGRREHAHVYGATLRTDEVTDWFGAPVTTVARTLVDLARHDPRDGIMAVDAALRAKSTTWTQLHAALDVAYGWPFVRRARRVVALANKRAESPLESLVRLKLHDDGFPAPEVQVEIDGYRVDLLFRAQRVIVEADGRLKYTDAQLWREKRRELRLRRLGFVVVRVTWADVLHNWPEVRAHLAAELCFPAGVAQSLRGM
jgi:very-short-patch-repair endonuclease